MRGPKAYFAPGGFLCLTVHVLHRCSADNGSAAVFSDNGGESWDWTGTLHQPGMDECTIAQTANGSLFAIMRSCPPDQHGQCAGVEQHPQAAPGNFRFSYSISTDGGTTFGPIRLHPDLVTPVCMSSLFAHRSGALLFAGPHSETSRSNLTVLASLDNGATFTRSLVITAGASGYSAMQCGLPGREDCGILYDEMGGSGLVFARFAFRDLKPFKSDDETETPSAPAPVPKTIGWFAGRPAWGAEFLLNEHADVADRVIACCSGMFVAPNGTMQRAPGFGPEVTAYGNLSVYQTPPYTIKEILLNFYGSAAAIPAVYARREAFSDELVQIALRYNASFICDWEFPQPASWDQFNATMALAASKLALHNHTISMTMQSGCGDTVPSWGSSSNPPCGTLFRSIPWAHKLVDMGTYQLTDSSANESTRRHALKLRRCEPPLDKITEFCGLEGQVFNHIFPIHGVVAPGTTHYPPVHEFAVGTSNGQYSAGLWPINCEANGTVAGGWTNSTLREFLSFLDTVGVRSVDVFCTGAAIPCPTIQLGQCSWFLDVLRWWKYRSMSDKRSM